MILLLLLLIPTIIIIFIFFSFLRYIYIYTYMYVYLSLSLYIYIIRRLLDARAAGPLDHVAVLYPALVLRASITSSQKLILTPGFLPPGYSLFSCVFLCFLPPGEILKSGVGITFGIPILLSYYYYHHHYHDSMILSYLIVLV